MNSMIDQLAEPVSHDSRLVEGVAPQKIADKNATGITQPKA